MCRIVGHERGVGRSAGYLEITSRGPGVSNDKGDSACVGVLVYRRDGRLVIDRVDGDRDSGVSAVGAPVVDAEFETVGAAEVRVWRVGDTCRAVLRRRTRATYRA